MQGRHRFAHFSSHAALALCQVMLLQGLDEAASKEWTKGTHHGGQHLHHLLKFLTVRHEVDDMAKGRTDRSGIMAAGGSYDPALDGALEGGAG